MDEAFRFGDFRVSATRRELWAAERPIAIGTRALDVLIALLKRPGELVTKSELIDEVWAGVAVEDNAIAAQVSAIRKTLGAGYVQTVPGRGYRFIAPVLAAEPARPAAAFAPTISAAPSGVRLGRLRPAFIVAAVAVLLLLGATILWRSAAREEEAPPWSAADTRGTFVIGSARPAGDPQLSAYAEQFQEALAARFTPLLGDFQVVPASGPGSQTRARYSVRLEFSRSGQGVTTRVVLLNARTGATLGVREFADALGPAPSFPTVWRASNLVKITAVHREAALALAKPANRRDARDLLYMALTEPADRHHQAQALAWTEEAYRLSPGTPIVRRALATGLDARVFQGWSPTPAADLARIRTLAEGLLRDDPQDSVALMTLADAYLLEGRWEDARAATERALAAKPDDALVLLNKLQAELALGRFADAEATYGRVRPFENAKTEQSIYELGGLLRFHGGRWSEAAPLLRRAIQVTPKDDLSRPAFAGLRLYLAAAEAHDGHADEARRDLRDFLAAVPAVKSPQDFWRWNDSIRLPLIDRDKLAAGLAKIGWR
jgi:DNA-binding winged helix-turn-helix (wHTH) protein/tetratricopeptide (TPR) repeat protein